jgi:outer membrane protein assembly factor BamA
MTLGMNMFAEDVTVIAGSALSGGGVASDFRRFGASLNTGIQISEHLGLSFGYQYLKKQAVRAREGYTQNRVTFTLGYRF